MNREFGLNLVGEFDDVVEYLLAVGVEVRSHSRIHGDVGVVGDNVAEFCLLDYLLLDFLELHFLHLLLLDDFKRNNIIVAVHEVEGDAVVVVVDVGFTVGAVVDLGVDYLEVVVGHYTVLNIAEFKVVGVLESADLLFGYGDVDGGHVAEVDGEYVVAAVIFSELYLRHREGIAGESGRNLVLEELALTGA